MRAIAVLLTLFTFGLTQVRAHATQNSFLQLAVDDTVRQQLLLMGSWQMALKDLNVALKLDADKDGAISANELRLRRTDVAQYLLPKLEFRADDEDCVTRETGARIVENVQGAALSLRLEVICRQNPKRLEVRDHLFFDLNPDHRGLMSLGMADQVFTGVFTAPDRTETFKVERPNFWTQTLAFVHEGVTHIWAGIDHILFLLALLLPSVVRRRDGKWQPVVNFREALTSVLKVVTAFTVAHSITLALAALEVIQLPSRLVEATIAVSVVLAALNNVFPVFQERQRWLVAFTFGLIHGFGFSSVLSELMLDQRSLVSSLLGFNIGVELGQLAIVAVFLPLAFAVRGSSGYRRVSLSFGSLVVAGVAAVWLLERVFDFKWLPI
jgi:HupE / UreJ protein